MIHGKIPPNYNNRAKITYINSNFNLFINLINHSNLSIYLFFKTV